MVNTDSDEPQASPRAMGEAPTPARAPQASVGEVPTPPAGSARRAQCCAAVSEEDAAQLLFCDGFDACIVGVVEQFGQPPRVAYDASAMLRQLVHADGMLYDDALEYFEFNITGAYVGPYTPAFVFRIQEIDE